MVYQLLYNVVGELVYCKFIVGISVGAVFVVFFFFKQKTAYEI